MFCSQAKVLSVLTAGLGETDARQLLQAASLPHSRNVSDSRRHGLSDSKHDELQDLLACPISQVGKRTVLVNVALYNCFCLPIRMCFQVFLPQAQTK